MARLTRLDLRKWLPQRSWQVVGRVAAADDVPNEIARNGAVLVGTRATPKWLAYDCPCGAGHRILLNLEPGRWPYWIVRPERLLTIWPSVDARFSGRRCHYFIKRGRVVWLRDRRRSQ
jgi:hypothetical protein